MKQGFTIIELIVVISIIAILASVVMINVGKYLTTSKDSAIKGNLATLITRGAKYFDSTGSYSGFCTDPQGGAPIKTAIEATNVGGAFTCNVKADNSVWCACSPEKATPTTVFCVDSSGAKKEAASTTCSSECPATAVCQ